MQHQPHALQIVPARCRVQSRDAAELLYSLSYTVSWDAMEESQESGGTGLSFSFDHIWRLAGGTNDFRVQTPVLERVWCGQALRDAAIALVHSWP